ncbi:MAG TPA: CDC48 family AAA ATPase [Candidatus Methanofastidiosa archaeon]|nr:CDC48 family AAA ATPase [Candidatus Methanofastidiosa archaeon]HPR42408.1 CDC48 family AAA ATPase [Candidatus Methanofastidiosa archaeon]
MKNEQRLFTVADAEKMDVGRQIIRLTSQSMEELELRTGDFVQMEGERAAVAVVWRGKPEDEGLDIIRMDGILRKNAGVSLGDKVKVSKIKSENARTVELAPLEFELQIRGDISEYFRQRLMDKPAINGSIFIMDIFTNQIPFMVTKTDPKGCVRITPATDIKVSEKPTKVSELTKMPDVSYEDIGGLGEEIHKIREMIELPMKHPEIFDKLGVQPPKGVLLYGPPGTGKTLLAKALANEISANFSVINGPEIMSKYYGESEQNLRNVFIEAEKNAPSIIFIDEIDAIAPKREEIKGEVERRVVSQLLTLMDGLKGRGKVVVIGATNLEDAIDPALRRPGRFDREIEIGVPDEEGRREILQIHTRGMPLEEVNTDEIASITHGYVGADLEALCKEAAMKALRRHMPEIKGKEVNISSELLNSLTVTHNDFLDAYHEVEPSGMREALIEVPDVKWEDVGGLESVKNELKEAIEWPLKYPEIYKRIGVNPPTGVLLYGPPGTGKTLLAKAVANESDANFITIRGPELISKWVGESEKGIRKVFKRARQVAPSIIFFDEIDAVAGTRGEEVGTKVTERMVNQLLSEMDGVEKLDKVTVIAATNRPDILDEALLRPGRFDSIIQIPMPDKVARLEILKVHTKKMPLAEDVDLEKLAEATDGYTGADIYSLVREAGMGAIRKDLEKAEKVTKEHFEAALEKVKTEIKRERKFFN